MCVGVSSPSRTATVPTTPASLAHSPTATASDRQEPGVCMPVRECVYACVFYRSGCIRSNASVCFTKNCIIEHMPFGLDAIMMRDGVSQIIRRGVWCVDVGTNVTEQCTRHGATDVQCDVTNE